MNNMNKILKGTILTSAIMFGVSSTALATFSDINENSSYSLAINHLAENNIINGYPDNTFKPDKKVTRAEFAKMISVAENLKINEENIKQFEDVDSHWANSYIELMSSNNLIKGYEDNTFKPEKDITYGEVVTILLRTLDIYEMYNENVKWPDDYMKMAEKIGLFDGIATNDLIGINSARRDNVALMIWNKIKFETEMLNNSGDKINNEENNNSNKFENDNQIQQEIDTTKNYLGIIELVTKRRGETYITLKDFEGKESEVKLNTSTKVPTLNSLMIYTLTSKGKVRLEKLFSIDDIDDNYLFVEKVEDMCAKIKDADKILDFESEEYEYLEETIELDEYTYYLAEMIQNDDGEYEFSNVIEVKKEELKLRKEDRIIFDLETDLAFVIRGIENIEE